MIRPLRVATFLVLLLPSCGPISTISDSVKARRDAGKKEEQPFGSTGIPPQLRGKGTAVAGGGNTPAQKIEITPDSEISWTDPDNPDAGVPQLNDLLALQKKNVAWESDEGVARQRAAREGKPILVWFTDSQRSPACKILIRELFEKKDFETWSKEKFVRLRVDAYARQRDPNLSIGEAQDLEVRAKNRVADMKERYKVLGYPTLLVLSGDGAVVGRYKGFRSGDADYMWGLMKQGEMVASKANAEWRAGLAKKGYREWQDRKGNKVFAKLGRYSEGRLSLVEPDGRRSQTTEVKLSDSDQEWIKQQKAMRGIQ